MQRKHRDDTPPNHINPQLLRQPSWLLHRNKKPFYVTGKPRSGVLDRPADLAKLAAYDAAVAALSGGKYTGLGIAINRGLQFIDLDKCRDATTTDVASWVPELLTQAIAMGAFVEVSMSGTGFHIVGYGPAVPSFKGAHVEVYCHGRYMAIGCEVISTGTDLLPDLAVLLAQLDARSVPKSPRPALRLVGSAPMLWPGDQQDAIKALKRLNPDVDYPDWIKVGMALHKASGGTAEGLELWDTWSRQGEKYVEGECARYWQGFKADGGVGMGTLMHIVEELGAEPQAAKLPKPTKATKAPLSEAMFSPVARRKEFSDDELMEVEHAPIPWLVDNLICPGVTLLAAPPKMGKSYFVLQMALCVGAGVPFLGRQTRQVQVSYFDLEEWEELLQVRRKKIGKANGIIRSKVRYQMEMTGGDVAVLEDIQRHIDEGSKLIVVDLLARVRDELTEDSKKNAYARDYQALRTFTDFVVTQNTDVAIVIVHHTNKGQHESWQDKISGSQGLAGASHTNMLMSNIDLRGLDDEARKDAMNYRRFHVTGKAVAEDEMMLAKMANGGGWEVSNKTTDEVKTFGKHALILQVLREADGRWLTAKEVKETVEGTLDSIKRMMARMASKGEIESGGQGGPGYRFVTRE
jgi:hypothetical protein